MYTHKRFTTVLMSSSLVLLALAGTAQAMEMTTGDSMMKKDDSLMVKGDAMMPQATTSMMHSDPMMQVHTDSMMADTMDLMFGSHGDAVVTLQTFLETHNFLMIPAGVTKGYFGSLTKSALMKYQTSVDVPATGYYGPITREVMSNLMKKDTTMMMKTDNSAMMQKATEAAMKSDSMMKKDSSDMMKMDASTTMKTDGSMMAH